MRDKVKRGGFWIDCYSLTPELARSIDKCSGKMSNLTKGLRLESQILYIPPAL